MDANKLRSLTMSIAGNKIDSKLLIAIILFLAGTAHSQPYMFYMNAGSDNASDIYRLDLSTGESQFFVGGIPNCQGVITDPMDQWVYITFGQGGAYLFIVNATDTSKMFEPLMNESAAGEVTGFAGVVYVPQANKFYVTWLQGDSGSETTIYDAATFKRLGEIDFGFSFSDMVSPDGRYIYQYATDSLGNMELYTFSTSTNSLVSTKQMFDVGPSTPDKAIEAGVSNRLLLGWAYPYDHSEQNGYYSVYDIPTQSNLQSINFPFICNAYLSADGNYIFLNRWNPVITDSTNNTGYAIYPGTVYVFSANTGELTQRLSLPPGGKILTFPNYPGMFYYYNDSTNHAISVSDTIVMPVGDLLDTLISLKEQCAANGSIDNQGVANSLDSKLNNARSRLEAGDSTAAKNMLEAFVNEVEAQKGKHLTTDAYLLLKFNAEYVAGRLP